MTDWQSESDIKAIFCPHKLPAQREARGGASGTKCQHNRHKPQAQRAAPTFCTHWEKEKGGTKMKNNPSFSRNGPSERRDSNYSLMGQSAPKKSLGRKAYFTAAISSSSETRFCSPVSIFLSITLPSFISVSPTIATKGTCFALAYDICFFIFAASG